MGAIRHDSKETSKIVLVVVAAWRGRLGDVCILLSNLSVIADV